jgi:hypothetical protein
MERREFVDTTTIVVGLILIIVIALLISRGRKPVAGLTSYDPEQFSERMNRSLEDQVVDVREPGEYRGGIASWSGKVSQ